MAFRIAFAKSARTDLKVIRTWSWARHPDTSERFLDGLYDRIGELATSPELGPVWRRQANLRRLLYEMFYVYYQVDESRRKVIVRAVWHTARRPPKLA